MFAVEYVGVRKKPRTIDNQQATYTSSEVEPSGRLKHGSLRCSAWYTFYTPTINRLSGELDKAEFSNKQRALLRSVVFQKSHTRGSGPDAVWHVELSSKEKVRSRIHSREYLWTSLTLSIVLPLCSPRNAWHNFILALGRVMINLESTHASIP